jgi:hypothetical protein
VSEGFLLAEVLAPISVNLYLMSCGLLFIITPYFCHQKNFTAEFKAHQYKNSVLIGVLCLCMLITSIFYLYSAVFDVSDRFYYIFLDSALSWSFIYTLIEMLVLAMVISNGISNLFCKCNFSSNSPGFFSDYNKVHKILFKSWGKSKIKVEGEINAK